MTFDYQPPLAARAIAGATLRAVFAPGDRRNVFRFARLFHDVTIVKGTSPFNDAAAKRLAEILQPWGVRCRELDLAEAAKTRPISDEEARTWVRLGFRPRQAGRRQSAGSCRLRRHGPGDPARQPAGPSDHRVTCSRQKFLPYATSAGDFPGVGRGWSPGSATASAADRSRSR